ncbi:hypothetical protein QJS04_geneDACA012223 [Acorus gramineus]|uniref:Uncharacterized protein n=1 Tax=Acorus gramineus TaxID=55184 RepID=A0AAV9BBF5_ACOGR|nr:hypothetical protein QJS04_geneDACA012223 [Acorus gramineus]
MESLILLWMEVRDRRVKDVKMRYKLSRRFEKEFHEIKTIKHKILSGTLTLSPDSCDLIIDCAGGGGGVDFIVAESDEDHAQHRWEAYGRLDARRLPEQSWW